ncbi:MAG: hypothetical protein Roseis3KO_55270 [Roseivirga sp.]
MVVLSFMKIINIRLKTFFFITVVSLCFIFQACELRKTGFDDFAELFDETGLPVTIDSAFLSSLNTEGKEYILLETELIKLSQIDELSEKHGEFPLYQVKLLSKVTLHRGIQGLIYAIRLNPEIPFDVKMVKVLLGLYNDEGTLTDSKEIGGFEYNFGHDKMIYSTLSSDMTLNMVYSDEKKNVSLGTSEVTESKEIHKVSVEGEFVKP